MAGFLNIKRSLSGFPNITGRNCRFPNIPCFGRFKVRSRRSSYRTTLAAWRPNEDGRRVCRPRPMRTYASIPPSAILMSGCSTAAITPNFAALDSAVSSNWISAVVSISTQCRRNMDTCKFWTCVFNAVARAALAAFAIKQRFEPDKKVHVQYTTTSRMMHEGLVARRPARLNRRLSARDIAPGMFRCGSGWSVARPRSTWNARRTRPRRIRCPCPAVPGAC